MEKPITTLFLLMSLDGKISTGNNDDRDVDKDFPKIQGIRDGLHQYYNLERTTDLFSLNTGRVMAKVGANIPKENVSKTDVSFIIIDNKPHLNSVGVEYFIKLAKTFYLVTTNKDHPTFQYNSTDNLRILYYPDQINFSHLFNELKLKYGVDSMTIQSGGSLNSVLLRENLIDKVSIVVAPVLVGGKDTSTLVDGDSLQTFDDLAKIKALRLVENRTLNNSYIHLKYEVINETAIE